MIAEKTFATVVGPKTANLRLSPARADDPNRSLIGDYQSEGRNILEARGVLVPVNATPEHAARLAERFLADAEAAIADSYAVRLIHAA